MLEDLDMNIKDNNIDTVSDKLISTVNLYYQRGSGEILGVSRREHHNLFGLPGGKVHDDETPRDALLREVKEETGIELDPDFILPIFERKYEGSDKYSRTYIYQNKIDDFKPGIHEDAGGLAKFISWDDLITGPFGIYNYRLGVELNIFLDTRWFISYTQEFNTGSPIIKNGVIDINPLIWQKIMDSQLTESFSNGKMTLISFQNIDNRDYEIFKKY